MGRACSNHGKEQKHIQSCFGRKAWRKKITLKTQTSMEGKYENRSQRNKMGGCEMGSSVQDRGQWQICQIIFKPTKQTTELPVDYPCVIMPWQEAMITITGLQNNIWVFLSTMECYSLSYDMQSVCSCINTVHDSLLAPHSLMWRNPKTVVCAESANAISYI